MTPKQKALDAARKAYVLAVKRNDGPTDTVAAIIVAYEGAREPRKPKRRPASELWAAMPSFVRVTTQRICERHGVEVDWLMAEHAPPGQRYIVADARTEIFKALYGRAYGRGHISYQMIGRWFGRDHATVMHAVKKPERLSSKLERTARPMPPTPTVEQAAAYLIRRRASARARYKRRVEERRARIKAPYVEAAE